VALLKRDNNVQPNIKNTADVSRNLSIKKEYKANERKTIKVDPPVYDLIKSMSVVTDTKMYNLVNQMCEIYLDNNVSQRQKETILLMLKQNEK
jgi:hypothetical protein